MSLRLILGPMKSGKSFDLIAHFAPLQHTDIPHILYQSSRHKREEQIVSRSGLSLAAQKVATIPEDASQFQVIGIDEIHMFPVSDVPRIQELELQGKEIIVSGLDMDYRGNLFPVIRALLELAPDQVIHKRAVCELCKKMDGAYTQVFKDGTPLLGGIPAVLSEDQRFDYKPVCRHCFVKGE